MDQEFDTTNQGFVRIDANGFIVPFDTIDELSEALDAHVEGGTLSEPLATWWDRNPDVFEEFVTELRQNGYKVGLKSTHPWLTTAPRPPVWRLPAKNEYNYKIELGQIKA